MQKTLTKRMLYGAVVKRMALMLTILFSMLCAAAAVLGLVVEDDDLSRLGTVLLLVVSVLIIYLLLMVLIPIPEIRDVRKHIVRQEMGLGIDFAEEMVKENIVYKGFREKNYISGNWFIYNKEIFHKDYIAEINEFVGLHSDGRAWRMVFRATRFDGVRFGVGTDRHTYYEFIEWYYKVNPEDPIWKIEYPYDAKLEGRNIPEGWMAPKKQTRKKRA